jgi:glucokinase
MNTSIIGIDLGGTNMRSGLVINNAIKNTESTPVPVTQNWSEVLDKLIEVTENVWTDDVKGIGIGVPGIVDDSTGVVYDIQNIPSWKEVPVGQLLSDHFKVPVYVNNDANCFAAGERFFGKGRDFSYFVGLISGTGLGAGIIKNGHLMPDQNCGSGEFGMIPYLDHNYEYYSSGQFFSHTSSMSGEETARLASHGDPVAIELFTTFGKHLANAMKTIIFALDPGAIILGGSVTKSFSYFEKSMKQELSSFPYGKTIRNLSVLTSELPEISIMGAAALYYENNNSTE